jgi:hypothetical protein
MTISEMASKSSKKVASTLKQLSRPLQRFWPGSSEAAIGMIALVVVLFVSATFYTPLAVQASKLVTGNRYLALVDGLINPFRNRELLLKSGLPVYDLRISKGQYAIIENAIEQAKARGWMSDDEQIWADGKFYYEGQEYNVKVRVRGDLPVHWENPKKSWRIKFGNQDIAYNGETTREPIYFQGKRQINLIIPIDRDYVVAAFVNQMLREAGLVVPQDQFVILRINGVLQGLYYEVEQFDKPLLAAQERPETEVFSQSERALHFEQYTKIGTPIASDAKYDIGMMRGQVEEGDELGMRAMQVLVDFANNPTASNFRQAQSVLDWEKYLSFRNITTLFNTNHVRFGSNNIRMYFDSSRGLLEPIPWNVLLVRMPVEPGTIDYFNSHGPDPLEVATIQDPELRLQRNKMMWEWVSDGGDDLIAKFDKFHEQIRPLAWADVLSTPIQGYRMDELRSDFVFNVRRVYRVLSFSSGNLNYRLETDQRASLELVADNFSGILFRSISVTDPDVIAGHYQLYQDINENGELDPTDPLVTETDAINGIIRLDLNKTVLPDVQYDGDWLDGKYWEYFDTLAGRAHFFLIGQLAPQSRDPLLWERPDIQVVAVNAVSMEDMQSAYYDQPELTLENFIGITAYDASDPFDLEAPQLSLDEFLEAHPEFQASQEQPGAVELSGNITLSGTVIVPKSVKLVLKPGTDITMLPSSSLVSYGGLQAIGTPEQRISIHGNRNREAWGTFAVVRPSEEVVLSYVDFQDGGQAQVNATLFTGGFAVHDGDLKVEHCSFTHMQSEDGFNLKNGHLYLDDTLVSDNASDGVDLDFVTGEVHNSQFLNNVGDGLDLSGNHITITNSRFEYNGDKGLSVGEDSHPIVINALFRGNQIGLSTKDLSQSQVAYATYVDNVLAIEAKRKKAFFGGGSGEFYNIVFSGNQTLLQEDYFSQGQVTIQSSISDDQGGCKECGFANISFQDSQAGDFRLKVGTIGSEDFILAKPDWMVLDGGGPMPELPGIFLAPPVKGQAIP